MFPGVVLTPMTGSAGVPANGKRRMVLVDPEKQAGRVVRPESGSASGRK